MVAVYACSVVALAVGATMGLLFLIVYGRPPNLPDRRLPGPCPLNGTTWHFCRRVAAERTALIADEPVATRVTHIVALLRDFGAVQQMPAECS